MPPNLLLLERVMTEPWVSVEQIAEHLGVTRDSIYRWIDKLAAFFERYFGLG